ncbi:MAG: hypothetical protein WC307_03100 [Candidatus Nanoarchaeia archaeon]|jgi:hypothetical protein
MKKINLTTAIQLKQEKLRIAEQEETRRLKDNERRITDYWAQENNHYQEKLSIATEAFKQLKDFNKKYSSQIETILEEFDSKIGLADRGVTLMSYTWAHKGDYIPDDLTGRWSTTYANKQGFLYMAGYKWMGFREVIQVNNPQDFASYFTTDYLTSLVQELSQLEQTLIKKLIN